MSQISRNRPSLASTSTSSLKGPAGEQAQGLKKGQPALLARGKDEFQPQTKAASLSGIQMIFGGNKAERANDGLFMGANGKTFPPGTPLKDIPGVTPPGNANPSKTILYVNGILTTASAQMDEMKAIAQTSGARVVGIHNSTQGIVSDLAECVGDKLDKGKNPAVDTLADTVYTELKAGREVHLMGYSQGGLITARALNDVQRRLRIEDGMSSAQVEKLMGKLSVETFGAASTRYPDGPQYVHYINNRDPVPTVAGLGGSVDPLAFMKDAGKGAVVHRFSEGGLNLLDNHMLNISYLKHRVPFEQARAGEF
ncbi:hypothetical protein NVS55_33270 [Myxococcus stipitatus]|uniref:hypothetical protein n=1 Tax=Myxococcus stipitatus TaxID=83455 RepID=UPI003144FF3E